MKFDFDFFVIAYDISTFFLSLLFKHISLFEPVTSSNKNPTTKSSQKYTQIDFFDYLTYFHRFLSASLN